MFMIVFRIHCTFFIALTIRLKACGSNVFFLLYKAKCARQQIGRISEVLRARAHPMGTRIAI